MSKHNIEGLNLFKDNKEAMAAYSILEETNTSVFLTGKAGTGKSTFIEIAKRLSKTICLVAAPTGIAALNVDGKTINSLFHLPHEVIFRDDPMLKNVQFNKDDGFIICNSDLLIIDEISMVTSFTLDNIDVILRNFCKSDVPFAGKKVLLVGDPFQLPPIVKRDDLIQIKKYYKSEYFFHAKVFEEANPVCIELKKNYRQNSDKFINILNSIRNKIDYKEALSALNKSCYNEFDKAKASIEKNCICLAYNNKVANNVNETELNKIGEAAYEYYFMSMGQFDWNGVIAEKSLILKKGARIMFIKNHAEKLFVNGTMGYIVELNEHQITVITDDGQSFELQKERWVTTQYKNNYVDGKNQWGYVEVGSMLQYPIKLAWAITVHKSQGLTFDKVHLINAQNSFLAGQTYVALSRCRTIEGLSLNQKLTTDDIDVNENVIEFYQTINESRVEEVLTEIADKLEAEAACKLDEDVFTDEKDKLVDFKPIE